MQDNARSPSLFIITVTQKGKKTERLFDRKCFNHPFILRVHAQYVMATAADAVADPCSKRLNMPWCGLEHNVFGSNFRNESYKKYTLSRNNLIRQKQLLTNVTIFNFNIIYNMWYG